MLRCVPVLVLCYMAVAAQAGQLTLSNGDQIAGELKAVIGDDVIWRSSQLGELRVKKNRVKNIETSETFKVRGKDQPCYLESMENQKTVFRCSDGDMRVVPFLALENVILFKGHSKTNYAYGGNLRASGWKQSGNAETEYWEILSDVKLRHGDLRHIFLLTASRTSSTDRDEVTDVMIETDTHRSLGSYALDWFFRPQVYWSNKLKAESDDNRNIREEYTFSSGLGYQWWESESTIFSSELGLQYSRTYLEDNPSDHAPEENTSVRLATDFRHKFASSLSISNKNEYTRSFNDPGGDAEERWEFRTENGLNFPIGHGISASFNLEWYYVNHARDLDPLASKTDTIYRFGVNYAW